MARLRTLLLLLLLMLALLTRATAQTDTTSTDSTTDTTTSTTESTTDATTSATDATTSATDATTSTTDATTATTDATTATTDATTTTPTTTTSTTTTTTTSSTTTPTTTTTTTPTTTTSSTTTDTTTSTSSSTTTTATEAPTTTDSTSSTTTTSTTSEPVTTSTTTTTTTTAPTTTEPETTPPPQPSLLTVSILGPASVTAGSTGNNFFSVQLCNAGPGQADGAHMSMTFPVEMQLKNLAFGPRGTCTSANGVIQCAVSGLLRVNECVSFQQNIYVLSYTAPPSGTTVTISATATASSPILGTSVLTASRTVNLVNTADIQFLAAIPGVATAGTQTPLDIFIGNAGPSQAFAVSLTVTMPFPVQNWIAEQGTCTLSGTNVLNCALGDLITHEGPVVGVRVSILFAVPETTNATIQVAAQAPSVDAFIATANASSPSSDPRSSNNAQQYTIDVLDLTDYGIQLDCTQAGVAKLTLQNSGPSQGSGYHMSLSYVDTNDPNAVVLPAECTLAPSVKSNHSFVLQCGGNLRVKTSLQLVLPVVEGSGLIASVTAPYDLQPANNLATCTAATNTTTSTETTAPAPTLSFDRTVVFPSGNSVFSWTLSNMTLHWHVTCRATGTNETAAAGPLMGLGFAPAPTGNAATGNGSWVIGNTNIDLLQAATGSLSSITVTGTTGGAAYVNGTASEMISTTTLDSGSPSSFMITIACTQSSRKKRFTGTAGAYTWETVNLDLTSGVAVPQDPTLLAAHAVLMCVSWGIFVAASVFLQLLLRWWPWVHSITICVAACCAIAGFAVGAVSGPPSYSTSTRSHGAHAILGVILFAWLLLQALFSIAAAFPVIFHGTWANTVWAVQLGLTLTLLCGGLVVGLLGLWDWGVAPGWYALWGVWTGVLILGAAVLIIVQVWVRDVALVKKDPRPLNDSDNNGDNVGINGEGPASGGLAPADYFAGAAVELAPSPRVAATEPVVVPASSETLNASPQVVVFATSDGRAESDDDSSASRLPTLPLHQDRDAVMLRADEEELQRVITPPAPELLPATQEEGAVAAVERTNESEAVPAVVALQSEPNNEPVGEVVNENVMPVAAAAPALVAAEANVELVDEADDLEEDDTPETPPPTLVLTNPNTSMARANKNETVASTMNADEGGLSSTEKDE